MVRRLVDVAIDQLEVAVEREAQALSLIGHGAHPLVALLGAQRAVALDEDGGAVLIARAVELVDVGRAEGKAQLARQLPAVTEVIVPAEAVGEVGEGAPLREVLSEDIVAVDGHG